MTNVEQPAIDAGSVFAERMRHFRVQRNRMSIKDLQKVCHELGSDLKEASLTNLERSTPANRRRVTVQDWLTIAAALGVPPSALLIPTDAVATNGQVELVPGQPVAISDALLWLEGRVEAPWSDDALGVTFPGTNFPGTKPQLPRALRALDLLREHSQLVSHLREHLAHKAAYGDDGKTPSLAVRLLAVRRELESRDEHLPDLPAELGELLVRAVRVSRGEPLVIGRAVTRSTASSSPAFVREDGDDG